MAVLSLVDWAGLFTFVSLALISQALAVESNLGSSKPVKSSTAFLPILATAVVFPPPAVILAVVVTLAVGDPGRKERDWRKFSFNIAQTVLAYGLGAHVFHGLSDGLAEFSDIANGFGITFVSFYGLATVFFGINVGLICGYISIRDGQRFLQTLQEASGRGGGNLLYDLLASPIALVAVYLYWSFGIPGLLIVVFPLLLIRYSYLSAIQLQKANRDLLRVLIKAIETRDPYTSGHSQRVSTLAKMIAEDHGLRPSLVNQIENAALLHDIGKIDALYAEIISKKSALTDHEVAVIRTHATKGADLLSSLTSLEREIIVGVRHHHERFDGHGYPDGLAGKDIPLAARIIMICDAVDAMLSDRPYRNALPISAVRRELTECSGSQFDPDIVRSILESNTLERAELLVDRSGARSPSFATAAAAG